MAPSRPTPRWLTEIAAGPTGRWLVRAVVAVVGAVGLTVWAAARVGGEATPRLTTFGIVVVGLVAGGVLAGSAELLAGGVIGVVGLCAVAVAVEPGPIALPIGLAAFVVAEAAFAAVDLGPAGGTAPTARAQRRRYLAAVITLAVLSGTLALVAADRLATRPNLASEALGGVAIAAVAVLVATLPRRT